VGGAFYSFLSLSYFVVVVVHGWQREYSLVVYEFKLPISAAFDRIFI
jgi:hypothetical protein